MLGMGRTVESGQTRHLEHMCIEQQERAVVYRVTVGGRPWVDFRQVDSGPAWVVFENLSNDYPQRIRYQRDDEVLTAQIEYADSTRPMKWTWTRDPEGL